MEHVISNTYNQCSPSNSLYSPYSVSYVYNMDTGLVEAHPATITETSMSAASDFSRSSAASRREQAGGLDLPAGDGCSEVTRGMGGNAGRNYGLKSGQFDNSQEFNHQGSSNSQSEISQNSNSLANSAQTYPICLSVSIADNDHELYVNGDGENESEQNEFLEKVVETSLGQISYSHLRKHQEYQDFSVEYEMIDEEDDPVNNYQLSEQHSFHQIVTASDVLRSENEGNEAHDLMLAINGHKSVDSNMAPAPKFINRSTNVDAPTSNYALTATNLVVVDPPKRLEQCPENGEIIYVRFDDGLDASSAEFGRQKISTIENIVDDYNINRISVSRLSARSDNEPLVIADGAGSAEMRVTEHRVNNTALENTGQSLESDDANIVGETPVRKEEFREPPRIRRLLGMFTTDEHDCDDEIQQKDNDSPPESRVDFHNVVTLHSSASTTSLPDFSRGRITLRNRQLIDAASTVVMSSANSLPSSSSSYDHNHTSRAVVPVCSNLLPVAAPSSQPIKPVALSASMPAPHQLIACGMTGVSPAVTHPLHPQPMLPISLPPLAVFAHPIHLFPATLPWHIHSHVPGPVPQITSARYPTNCPHYNQATTNTNTTATLNSTAGLAASYPLLKRGRRPRRFQLTNSGPPSPPPPQEEANSDGSSPPLTKRTEANARERERVTHLNGGFEQLRRVLPWSYRGGRRVSKVDTLRAAISYIRFLQSVLVGTELSPAEAIRLRNGIVLENTVRIVQNVHKAPYPILPPGYRFVNPPQVPLPVPPHPSLPPRSLPPHPTLPTHPSLPLPTMPPQQRALLPPVMHLSRPGYEGQAFQTVSMRPLLPSHSTGLSPGNQSTALSWLINFQGSMGVPPIDNTEGDVIMLGASTQVSTNQNTKENHVTERLTTKPALVT